MVCTFCLSSLGQITVSSPSTTSVTSPTKFAATAKSTTSGISITTFKIYVDNLAATIKGLGPEVVETTSTYYQAGDPTMVSRDKRSTLIAVVMAGNQDSALDNVAMLHDLVAGSGGSGFTLAQTG
jgi:hypothetical protein